MKRPAAILVWLILAAAPALAQNRTCPVPPNGDSSNRCAPTAFVQGAFAGGGAPQSANEIFAGPTTGSAAAPTFRLLVGNDLGTGSTSSTVLQGNPSGASTWVSTLPSTVQGNISQTGTVTSGIWTTTKAGDNNLTLTDSTNSRAVAIGTNQGGGFPALVLTKSGITWQAFHDGTKLEFYDGTHTPFEILDTGIYATAAQLNNVIGSTQCLHADSSGNVTGFGFDCNSNGPIDLSQHGVTTANSGAANLSAYNAVAAAYCASSGCALYLPQGNFSFSDAIVLGHGVSFQCAGKTATTITNTGANKSIFSISGGGNNTISDCGMTYQNAQTTSSAIAVVDSHGVDLRRLTIYTNVYIGISLASNGAQDLYSVRDVEIDNPAVGIDLGHTGSSPVIDVGLDNNLIAGSTVAGIRCTNASGLSLINNNLEVNYVGVLLAPGSGQFCNAIQGFGNFIDTSTTDGLVINPATGGTVAANVFTGLWAASSGGRGVVVTGTGAVGDIQFDGLRMISNTSGGYAQDNTNAGAISLHDVHAIANNQGNASKPAIYFGPGVSHFSVIGGYAGTAVGVTTLHAQTCGVQVDTGASDYYTITSVDAIGATTSICDGGTGSHKNVSGNF